MGREYKTRLKEQYGKLAVVAYETVEVGGNLAPAASGPTNLSDRNGVATWRNSRPAKLDGLHLQLASALPASSGTVRVRALVNGVAVGSGTIAAGSATGDVMFETEADAEVRLATGSTLVLDVTKGATATVQGLTARASLRLFEL